MSNSPAVPTIPPNIYETKVGLVCLDVDMQTGVCKTWAIMRQPEPLLPKLTPQQLGEITSAILGVIVFTWVFIMLKRAI